MNCFPPPTINMNYEQLTKMKLIVEQYLIHLKEELPLQCEREGHQWGEAVHHRGEYKRTHGYGEHEYDEYTYDYFERTCKRCGKAERKDPIIKNPFGEQQ